MTRKMLKEERDFRCWASAIDPDYDDPKEFLRDVSKLVRAVREDCARADQLNSCAALNNRIALLEKVVSVYSALFRGVTQDKQMLLLPKGAYEEIEAALDALKGDR